SSGRIAPKRSFAHGNHRDLVFGFTDRPEAALAAADPAPEETRKAFAALTPSKPPFGYLDVPAEGASVASGSWSFGWSLGGSGIAEVLVAADGGPPRAASLGEPHAGVAEAYPGFPGLDKPGFAFALPALPLGPHTLTLTLVARDGGRST